MIHAAACKHLRQEIIFRNLNRFLIDNLDIIAKFAERY